ncbi:uncharacterized protein N7503_011388 [Penicillium pulvis]|uniref:uncharacterized protein n=1 Tax=Penicillium pulvis TaxID=1562058 RepID=UPI00254769F4|nr:uncharacterized protein N7503_011388 [Penicillium pulvis]KAJ5786176.1 hypothetical protein N7503_011388 [Penicillium pulvis]
MVKEILKDRHYAASLPKEVRKSVEVIFRRSFVAAPVFVIAALILTVCLVRGETEEKETCLDEQCHD